MELPRASFAPAVTSWRRGLGRVRDAVRQELVTRQLAAHLPDAAPATAHVTAHVTAHAAAPATVLDVGCGQGTQAIRLARRGFHVTGVDVSGELLDVARETAAAEPEEVRRRLTWRHGDLLDDPAGGERFDAVCCHGVLMYLPSLAEGVAAVVAAAGPGATVSILTRNRAGLAMRAGMAGRWADALDAFDARHYRNRVGVEGARADEPAEVAAALAAAGATVTAWYGVRLWSDHLDGAAPVDLPALVEAEAEAGRRDPYRAVCALTHTLATVS